MTKDDYLKIQENNKKIYELLHDEEKKRKILAAMMEEEIKFVKKNIPPIEISETLSGQPLNMSMPLKEQLSIPLQGKSDFNTLCVAYEKLTPENAAERMGGAGSSDPSIDLKRIFKNNPEQVKNMCFFLNALAKADLRRQFGNQPDLQIVEDDKQIVLKRCPEHIKNPDNEVNNIVNRARNAANPQTQAKQMKGQEMTMEIPKDSVPTLSNSIPDVKNSNNQYEMREEAEVSFNTDFYSRSAP